jgi:hypothetical protein
VADFPEVPGYELQAELGRGGMAVVYSAIEADLGRQVAIKIVRPEVGVDSSLIQRLENEARGLAALHHPHIVDLYRFGRLPDGALYYVMPLLSGGSLEEVPKPMPEDKVVALLDNLLDALAHAHGADIVHRDIKPANILFDRHGRPLLADFGAAFMRKRDTRLTTHGHAIGSSGFMSPEQARGMAVDSRSDLYSVAVLAFELLTGKMPFVGEDALSTALAQIEQPVPRLPPELKHWQAFFDRSLAVTAEHRFPHAAAMRAAMHGLQARAPRNTVGRTGMVVGVAVGVLVLGGLAFAVWQSRAPADPARVEVAKPAQRSGQPKPSAPGSVVAPPAPQRGLTSAAPKRPQAIGDRFSDPGGPELVLARAAKGSHPALAVMAAPVDAATYRRFASERGRKPMACAKSPTPAQGCLDLATAKELARWLGKETGEHYRVPTRAELDPMLAHVARVPAYAWSSTCHDVRVARPANAAKRGWARVRKAFGKPKPVAYDLRCDGHYALKLDGRGDAAKAYRAAAPETVVVLVRELRS